MAAHCGTRRVAIVRLSAIGDVVHGLPLARSVRRVHPDAEITWIVQREGAPLLDHHPWVDRVEIFPRRGSLLDLGRFLRRLGRPPFDLAIDAQGNLKSGLVVAATRAGDRLGLDRGSCREVLGSLAVSRRALRPGGPHSVDRTLALCRALGDDSPRPEYGLAPTSAEIARAAADLAPVPDPVVAFSVGSREDVREWPDDGYVAAARLLGEAGVAAFFLSGPRHRERARLIAGRAGVPSRAGTPDLRGLLGHLAVLRERGSVLVACDSAPIHLAVALSLSVVALAGPQDPRRTGPYGLADRAITRWEGLPCAPCLERACRLPETPRACMTRIGPAEVVRRALDALAGATAPSPSSR